MSYLYRKLTPKQKGEIIQFRRERGYPEHSPPHPFRNAGIYLISASCYNHMPVLESPFRRTEFEIMLFQEMSRTNSKIIGWTILSNHYHFLVDVDSLDYISGALRNLHGSTSRKWNLEDGTVGRRQVWYKYSDRLIRSETHMLRALNYIHFNSVKHGYTEDPYEWLWSSLPLYFEDWGRERLRMTWRENPPGDFGDGWDD